MISLTPGRVALIELSNGPLNLIDGTVMAQLDDALEEVAADSATRALVLAATGDRAFCAGSDVKEFESLHRRVAQGKLLYEKYVYRKLARTAVPSIAAIERDALGGGLELALCCDLRVAGGRARFGMPEVRLAVMPGSGGTQRLPAVVGPARAKEMILMGEVIDANRAAEIGLVNAVVEDGRARAAAFEMAEKIAANGPVAVRQAKELIDLASDVAIDAGLAFELDGSERVFSSKDMREGARAFFAKQSPRFSGE